MIKMPEADQQITVLLVEDDENLGFILEDNLEMEGYRVVRCLDGEAGWVAFHENTVDLCVLDVMLPKKDGFSLAEAIRKQNKAVPVVFLTARSMKEDRIKGFRVGGDDYITKPFSVEEFLLRVEAILKRTYQTPTKADQHTKFELGTFVFDPDNQLLIRKGKEQSLTTKEAKLLRLLCLHKNQTLTRETATKVIWGDDDYFMGRSMDVYIAKLRKYLKAEPQIKINNVHGVGFRLEV